MSSFNRILRLFRDDLGRPEFQSVNRALSEVAERHRRMGRPLRSDFGREWENAHVLLEVERLAARASVQRVLDLGGGNSPVCYYLAEKGFQVVVLDSDPGVVQQVEANKRLLPWGERLCGLLPARGRWPVPDGSFDCIVCISVFEGILPGRRPSFWSEVRRALRPGGSALLTFDYGPDARCLGDPPTTVEEIMTQIVGPSGLDLVGEAPAEPEFDPELGPPVKAIVPTIDGMDYRAIAYSFGALHLRKPEP